MVGAITCCDVEVKELGDGVVYLFRGEDGKPNLRIFVPGKEKAAGAAVKNPAGDNPIEVPGLGPDPV